jgi:flagellar basal-body rod protein FlgB
MIRELLIDNPTINTLKRGLEATSLRHRVISDNIVNAGVSGHQPREVRFESLFDREFISRVQGARTNPQHRSTVQAQLPRPEVVDKSTDADAAAALEAEMVAQIENSAKHRTLVKLPSGNYKAIVTAIRGRSVD